MTWHIAIGCVLGGAAAVLVKSMARLSKYCLALWRVIGSVQPRRRGAGTSVPKQPSIETQSNARHAAANDDLHGGSR
jgi:hypothetical protein